MSVLKIHHLGPITDCEINIKDFTILTGPQASGKSTVAKAIFFFRTTKQDFYDQLTTFSADEYHSTLEKDLKKRLRSKFIQIFGTSWAMPQDMRISYEFSHWVTISVYLSEDRYRNQRNFVDFEFDEKIRDFIEKYKDYEKVQWDEDRLQSLKAELAQLFSDPYEIVYVPAGRSMITLLSDGVPIAFDEAEAKSVLSEQDINISVELNEGNEKAVAWGCDLSYEYVKINGDYRS